MKKNTSSIDTLPDDHFDFSGPDGEKLFPQIKNVDTFTPFFVRKIPVWKRLMDIIGAILGLILLFPVMLAIAILIIIVSPGPVFFKQIRIGNGGKPFQFWKFRTMKVNADTCTHQNYLADLINGCNETDDSGKPMAKLDPEDAQIIPFGKFLRNTCMDELPQLINVLRGEMSLVGPRPPIPYEVKEYLRWHNGRFDIVPGMTGLWQVSGKNRLTFKEMIRLDIRYTRSISIWSDLKILFKTPMAIIDHLKFHREQARFARKGVGQNV
jgi:lipopolysaccharide/colanic/teichoic acid biosynthesis glycosyltransferase